MSDESLRERLSSLSRGELVALVTVLAVTLGAAGLWYVRSLPRPVEVRAQPRGAAAAGSARPPPEVVLLVDVAGWVRRPGVYEFAEGARVIDAIDAAGGARHGAMLEALNLAAQLVDGTQILVPREGAGGTPPEAGGTVAGGGTAAGLINVNTATATELEELPGIGEVLAQAIIDYRTENGPFASVDDMVDVSGIGDATLEEIRDLVTV